MLEALLVFIALLFSWKVTEVVVYKYDPKHGPKRNFYIAKVLTIALLLVPAMTASYYLAQGVS